MNFKRVENFAVVRVAASGGTQPAFLMSSTQEGRQDEGAADEAATNAQDLSSSTRSGTAEGGTDQGVTDRGPSLTASSYTAARRSARPAPRRPKSDGVAAERVPCSTPSALYGARRPLLQT